MRDQAKRKATDGCVTGEYFIINGNLTNNIGRGSFFRRDRNKIPSGVEGLKKQKEKNGANISTLPVEIVSFHCSNEKKMRATDFREGNPTRVVTVFCYLKTHKDICWGAFLERTE